MSSRISLGGCGPLCSLLLGLVAQSEKELNSSASRTAHARETDPSRARSAAGRKARIIRLISIGKAVRKSAMAGVQQDGGQI